jgi:hypothetical protein
VVRAPGALQRALQSVWFASGEWCPFCDVAVQRKWNTGFTLGGKRTSVTETYPHFYPEWAVGSLIKLMHVTPASAF